MPQPVVVREQSRAAEIPITSRFLEAWRALIGSLEPFLNSFTKNDELKVVVCRRLSVRSEQGNVSFTDRHQPSVSSARQVCILKYLPLTYPTPPTGGIRRWEHIKGAAESY